MGLEIIGKLAKVLGVDPIEFFRRPVRSGSKTATFWPAPRPFPVTDEGAAERSFELYWRATQLLRVDEHDRALMAPKLNAKARAMTTQSGPEAIFEARAIAAQIGWLETSLPALLREQSAPSRICCPLGTPRTR